MPKNIQTALISQTSKVMLKILQARLQHYMNHELPDVQVIFRKGRGTWDKIANIYQIIVNAKQLQKTCTSASLTTLKSLTVWITTNCGKFCVDHNKLWKYFYFYFFYKLWRVCLLRNLYAGQKSTVRTGCGTTDWFHIGKGVYHCCILSPCLFNLYAEYIMQHAGLYEAQAGIKTAGRNITNVRYADDTTLLAES